MNQALDFQHERDTFFFKKILLLSNSRGPIVFAVLVYTEENILPCKNIPSYRSKITRYYLKKDRVVQCEAMCELHFNASVVHLHMRYNYKGMVQPIGKNTSS